MSKTPKTDDLRAREKSYITLGPKLAPRPDVFAEYGQLETDLAEAVSALRELVTKCGKCWGNGHYIDKYGEKMDCEDCEDSRKVIAKHSVER